MAGRLKRRVPPRLMLPGGDRIDGAAQVLPKPLPRPA